MYQLEFAMFQGLKSHKPDFADELVRPNEKRAPFRAFNLSHPPPKIWHVLMTTVLMNNTVSSRNKSLNIIKKKKIIVLYMYARTRILRGYDEAGFCVIDLHP